MTTKIRVLKNREQLTHADPAATETMAWAAYQFLFFLYCSSDEKLEIDGSELYDLIYERIKSSPYPYAEFRCVCRRFIVRELNKQLDKPDVLLTPMNHWMDDPSETGFYAEEPTAVNIKPARKENPVYMKQLELLPYIILHLQENQEPGNCIYWMQWTLTRSMTFASCAIGLVNYWKSMQVFSFRYEP